MGDEPKKRRVVVTGFGAVTPVGLDAESTWRSLLAGKSGIDFIHGMRLLAGARLDTAAGAEVGLADWSRITAGDWLRQTLDRLRHPETIADCQPGRDLRATLRPYQVEGVRWLWFMTELGGRPSTPDDVLARAQ